MRRALLLATALLAPSLAAAVPLRVSAAERRELESLARRFFESTRDGARSPEAVFPSRAELGALFERDEGLPGPVRVAARPNEPVVLRQLNAIDRDVQALRERFRAGVFVGLAGPVARENTLRQRPCGRFARRDAQCADGLMLEYRVGNETRRFNVDTLVRAGGRWRILDVRH